MPSNDFIYGVGDYDDSLKVAERILEITHLAFTKFSADRNRLKLPVKLNKRVFLCEGRLDDEAFYAL